MGQLLKQTDVRQTQRRYRSIHIRLYKARRSSTDQMEVGSKGPINPHSYQFQHRKCC